MSVNFSFIIPHKNSPELLQRCVDSIPFRADVQIIIVDDNSDEDKKPVIRRKGVEIVLLDAPQSCGAGRARNVGIQCAKGKWLLFADADDYYGKNLSSFLDEYLEKDCDIIYFNFAHLDGVTFKELPPLFFQKEIEMYDSTKEAMDIVRFHHNVPWTKMVSAEYIKTHNLFFEEVPNGNDILFSLMAGYFTKRIAVERTPIYVYLKNQNSILTSKETVQSAFCRLTHLVKINYFYDYVGHPEWRHSVLVRIVKYLLSLGFPFLFFFLRRSVHLYKNRKEWCKLVMSPQNNIEH